MAKIHAVKRGHIVAHVDFSKVVYLWPSTLSSHEGCTEVWFGGESDDYILLDDSYESLLAMFKEANGDD